MPLRKRRAGLDADKFQGGVITSREPVLIPDRGFSDIKNFRPLNPGFESRKGMARHHTTADTSTEAMTVYQYSKGAKDEKHFYVQRVNGTVDEATDNPPTVTTGVLGTNKLAAVTDAIPGSWSNIKDMCLFSDSKRQHQVYTGTDTPVSAFVVFKNTTVPAIPEDGEDYSVEVSDGQPTTVGDLSSLGANEFFFVMTPVPIKGLTVDVLAANANASVLTMQYWKGSWSTVAITDGTASGGATIAVDGSITWTQPSDELPHYQFGQSGYWYKFKVSAALDATTTVSSVDFNTDWQDIVNVWDGVMTEAIEAKVYDTTQLKYSIFGTNSIDLGQLGTDDFLYIATVEPISGLYIDVGATPNVTKAVVTGSSNISFFNNTSPAQDYLEARDANLLTAGFEEGMSVAITGTTNNNNARQILRATSTRLYFEPGALTTEADQSATITFALNTTALDKVETWTGTAFEDIGASLDDGTNGLTNSGFVTWDRTQKTPQQSQFQSSLYYAYWYKISFDKALTNSVNIGVQTMPYFDISKLGLGKCNAVWKDRGIYTFDKFGQFLYISEKDQPMHLNGFDYGILEAGDGRKNPVRSMKKFYNELIAWQEETGEAGGCTTLFEGYSPETFGKLVLSTKIGIMNSKCSAVVEGVKTSTATDEKLKTLAFWLSREGVMVTDGQTISVISDDIQNYFNPTKTESIRRGYEDKMWLEYDSAYNVIRVGLVSGTSATLPNVFFSFDLVTWTWIFDELAEPLSCITEVEATSGDTLILQYGGGADDGYVYRLNTGKNDIVGATPTTTAINKTLTIELDNGGEVINVADCQLRCKSQTAGDIVLTSAINGNSTYDHSHTLSMVPEKSGDSYKRNRPRLNRDGHRVSVKFQNNVVDEEVYLADIDFKVSEKTERKK